MYLQIIFTLLFLASFSLEASQVIYLNGTSSVGKTTLAKALRDNLDQPYMLVGIDTMIELMPPKINNWQGGTSELGFSWEKSQDAEGHPLQILHMGTFAAKMPTALKAVSKGLADAGFNVIIDDVACDENSYVEWKDALKGHQVIWVGLTAPLEVIEKREKERGDRQIGQARAIYNIVHKGFKYDLYLDTSKKSIPEMTQEIISKNGK
jgi:chloramphenicol 3-O phosphotransferase